MSYFGRLKNIDMTSMSHEEKQKLYIKRRLFIKNDVISIPIGRKTDFTENNIRSNIEPKNALTVAYYGFIIEAYGHHIEEECLLYLHPYNKITFGMEPMEVKKVARQYYLHIAENIKEKSIKWVRFDPQAKGTKKIANSTPLEDGFDKRNALQSRLIKEHPEGLEQYLMGNKSYFTSNLLPTVPMLLELIRFEGGLQSLLALNEDFSFEEDRFFDIPIAEDKDPLDTQNRKLGKKSRKASMPTDQEAKEYLIAKLFRKKR